MKQRKSFHVSLPQLKTDYNDEIKSKICPSKNQSSDPSVSWDKGVYPYDQRSRSIKSNVEPEGKETSPFGEVNWEVRTLQFPFLLFRPGLLEEQLGTCSLPLTTQTDKDHTSHLSSVDTLSCEVWNFTNSARQKLKSNKESTVTNDSLNTPHQH